MRRQQRRLCSLGTRSPLVCSVCSCRPYQGKWSFSGDGQIYRRIWARLMKWSGGPCWSPFSGRTRWQRTQWKHSPLWCFGTSRLSWRFLAQHLALSIKLEIHTGCRCFQRWVWSQYLAFCALAWVGWLSSPSSRALRWTHFPQVSLPMQLASPNGSHCPWASPQWAIHQRFGFFILLRVQAALITYLLELNYKNLNQILF